jgi:hypothetical protein
VGIGPIHWFERALVELGHELWVGDSAKIRASEVERDSRLILDVLLAKRFPGIWVPTPAERDLRQLLWPRHSSSPAHYAGQSAPLSGDEPRPVPQEKVVH